MEITITLSEEDQSLQAEILKVLLTPISDESDKSDKSDETPKAAEKPTTQPAQKAAEKPAPKHSPLPTDPAPSDPSDPSDTSDKTAHTSDSSDKAAHTSDKSDPSDKPAPALSMADLRKSVNAISRKKGLNWLYSWLGDLGVKSIADIPVARLEEANTKLQNYA